jgi:outer membrane lipoprotein-sorting protein
MLFSIKWCIAFALIAVLVAASASASAVEPKNEGVKSEAENVFRDMEEKLAQAKTLQCNLMIKCDFGGQMDNLAYKGSLFLGEGNRARQEIKEPTKGPPMRLLMVSDGARLSMQDNGMSHATLENTPKYLNRDILTWMARSGVFLPHLPLPDVEADDAKDRFPVSGFKLGDKEKIGERAAQRLEYQLAVKGQDPTFSVTVWLDAVTGLPVKRMLTSEVGTDKITVVETYSKLTLDEKVDAKKFDLPK